ncbi:DUF4238 domain-containing protein [Hyphomonas sp.]|uniref:DUF4238 domain-containing protein n=1 Tax=Hyphomonas sp. TaxID=87 RepID=UPI0032429F08
MNRHDRRKAKRFEAKRQHYVAKGYLEAWLAEEKQEHEEPFVWVFKREDDEWGEGKRKSPKKIFRESDMYTRLVGPDNQDRDISIEKALGRIEAAFCKVRRDFIEPMKPLTEDAIITLAVFAAATQFRTPGAREHIRSQWEPVLRTMKNMQEQVQKMTPEERKRLPRSFSRNSDEPSMEFEDVEKIVDAPLQNTLITHIQTVSRLLCHLNFSILHTSTDPGFITSDEPCVWFDPEAYKRGPMFRGPALKYKSLEITLPISPSRMLLISHQDFPEYFDVDEKDFAEMLVNDINRRTCGYASSTVVVNRNEFRKIWAERGEPPPDAHPITD